MPMFWYDTQWKSTTNLSVWDGSWKEVKRCWIYDGSWKLCHTAPASLDSFSVFDFGGGTLEFSWTYTSSFTSDWGIRIDKSSDSGGSWTNIASYTLGDSPQSVTSLSASDWYRCRMVDVTDENVQATDSPRIAQPPYPT